MNPTELKDALAQLVLAVADTINKCNSLLDLYIRQAEKDLEDEEENSPSIRQRPIRARQH